MARLYLGSPPISLLPQMPEVRQPEQPHTAARAAGAPPATEQLTGWGNSRASGHAMDLVAPEQPRLSAFLAHPTYSAASGARRHAVVLAHGFPLAGLGEPAPSYGYPQLAVRLAAETGAAVLTFDFRGTGESEGDFSLRAWRADLERAITHVRGLPGVERVWLVGFAAGGTLAIIAAGLDPAIAGVAAFAPPAELVERGADPRRLLAQARSTGMIKSPGFPADVPKWARELREVSPTQMVARVPPRPLLIVHGVNDDIVPITDARELADAANSTAELRVLGGAGHMLFHDPRAVALLLGWFDRHLGAAT